MQKPSTSSAHSVQLSPNFALAEFLDSDTAVRHGIENVPNHPSVMTNLFKLAAMLEEVRAACGNKPVVVSSGYRSPEVNRLVGGSQNSDHMRGEAADFRIPGFGTPLQVARAIVKAGIKFGQLIFEGNWVHISIPDGHRDNQILTARFVRQEDGSMKTQYVEGMPA